MKKKVFEKKHEEYVNRFTFFFNKDGLVITGQLRHNLKDVPYTCNAEPKNIECAQIQLTPDEVERLHKFLKDGECRDGG